MGHKDQDRMRQPGTPAGQTRQEQPWRQDQAEDPEADTTDMEQGELTRPAQPEGTTPLERDQWPENQKR